MSCKFLLHVDQLKAACDFCELLTLFTTLLTIDSVIVPLALSVIYLLIWIKHDCLLIVRTLQSGSTKIVRTLQSESEEFYCKYVYTHKEFVLMTGASSAEEGTDIVQTYIGITQKEWNITPI